MSTVPYVRKRVYYKRKRPGPPASRWSIYGRAGGQLWKDVLYLKSLVNTEPHRKFVQSANNFNYNGIIVSLSTIASGTGADQRNGQRCLPRYINVNWEVTAGDANQKIRVMLFRYWGEATSDATPSVTVGEVLRGTGDQFAPLSHLNEDNVGSKGDRLRRIEVLRSQLYSVDQIAVRSVADSWDVEVNGMNVQRKDHIEWPGSATTEPVSGGFYMLFISGSVVNSSYGLESKLTFYDN